MPGLDLPLSPCRPACPPQSASPAQRSLGSTTTSSPRSATPHARKLGIVQCAVREEKEHEDDGPISSSADDREIEELTRSGGGPSQPAGLPSLPSSASTLCCETRNKTFLLDEEIADVDNEDTIRYCEDPSERFWLRARTQSLPERIPVSQTRTPENLQSFKQVLSGISLASSTSTASFKSAETSPVREN